MKIFYKMFKMDTESRDDIITMTSGMHIVANIVMSLIKIIIGTLASSVAIVSEGINGAADVLTAVLTLIGTKLAGKNPDEKHPFGYGRIEYLTGLVVSTVILVAGIEMLKTAIQTAFHPEELSVSYLALAIVAGSAVIKFLMGVYTIAMGKKAGSSSLEAVGKECRGDAFVSIVTIISAVVFLVGHINIDAYAGIFTSLIIIKAGVEVLRDTLAELIGRPGEHELASTLYKEIRATEGVLNAADMMLHNYGPDAWSGSVNVEMAHDKSVGDVYQILHALQLRIMHEYNVVMVFGIYAVDNQSSVGRALRQTIAEFVKAQEHVKSYHAVYLEPGTNTIYCDLVVDYKQKDWDALREEFTAYMKKKYPDQELTLVIETEYVTPGRVSSIIHNVY